MQRKALFFGFAVISITIIWTFLHIFKCSSIS